MLRVGDFFQHSQCLAGLAGLLVSACLQQKDLGVFRVEFGRFVQPLQALVGFSLEKQTVAHAPVDGGSLCVLVVALVEFSQPFLDLDVVRFEVQQFLHDLQGFVGLVAFEKCFAELQIVGASLAHQPLHGVEFGQPFERAGVLGIDLADLLEHRDAANQEAALYIDISESGIEIECLGDVLQADVEVAQSIQGGLVVRIRLVDFQEFGDGLFQLVLHDKRLGFFECFCFVESHQPDLDS